MALDDSYRPTDEHEQLRAAVHRLVADKIAPAAAEVDETATFPKVAYDALRAADLHAVHVPEATAATAPTPWPPASSSRRSRGAARRPR